MDNAEAYVEIVKHEDNRAFYGAADTGEYWVRLFEISFFGWYFNIEVNIPRRKKNRFSEIEYF